jgi:hypothetical protein
MAFELDQSTYLDAEDEPLDLFRHSDLIDGVDFLPDDDGGDEDGVFADSMDYQEFEDMGDDSLRHSLTNARPLDAAHDDYAMKTTSDSESCLSSTELKAQYYEALQKLAESMQRTEVSRRQVIMHRHMLTPEQIFALEMAKEQLRRQQHQTQLAAVARQQQESRRPSLEGQVGDNPPTTSTTNTRSLSPGRSSIMDAFFSGSRGNLTNGLDQSRAQLGNYMGQMNHRILWG